MVSFKPGSRMDRAGAHNWPIRPTLVIEGPDGDIDHIIRSVRENGGKVSNQLLKELPALADERISAETVAVFKSTFAQLFVNDPQGEATTYRTELAMKLFFQGLRLQVQRGKALQRCGTQTQRLLQITRNTPKISIDRVQRGIQKVFLHAP